MEFPRGRGWSQVGKSWKFQVMGVILQSPLEQKILRGRGLNWKKTLPEGAMDIFWNHIVTIQQPLTAI